MKYKHIIWDYDGTLMNTYPSIVASFQEALLENNIDTSNEEEITFYMKQEMSIAIKYYKENHNVTDSIINRFQHLRDDIEKSCASLFPQVYDICKYIYANGGSNYIVTHKDDKIFYFLDKFDLSKYIKECVTQQYDFPRKPNPQSIQYLLEKYDIEPSEALMIGDRDLDIQAGLNAGIDTCFFTEYGQNRKTVSASHQISNFGELFDLL